MTLDEFMPYILPDAKGCPEITATFNVRLAVIELCREALLWREYQPAITTVAAQTAYAYTPATGQQVAKLLGLTLAGSAVRIVDPKTGTSLDDMSEQCAYAYGGLRTFQLRPAQSAGLAVITYSAVAPSNSADTIPDEFAQYMEQISRGALYRLKMTKGHDYSDPAHGALLHAMWEADIADARLDAFTGFARSKPRTTPAWF